MADDKKVTREQKMRSWRKRLRAQRKSGLSEAAFCRREGVSFWSFRYWKSKLSEEPSGVRRVDNAGSPFVRVSPEQEHSAASGGESEAIELVLAQGRRIAVRPGFDGDTLARLVALCESGRV